MNKSKPCRCKRYAFPHRYQRQCDDYAPANYDYDHATSRGVGADWTGIEYADRQERARSIK
jgi:hypothetical protein